MPASREEILKTVLRPREPLGPIASETLLNRRNNSFLAIYDATSETHHVAGHESPVYIVGRKGAGKTAFLVGAALTDDADVVFLGSDEVYTEVEKLRIRLSSVRSPVFADTLSHVWDVLLVHAAMLGCARSEKCGESPERRTVRRYLGSYGDYAKMTAGELTARVGKAVADTLVDASPDLTFVEACNSLSSDRGSYLDARRALERFLEPIPVKNRICVVVDNLEDLHVHIDDLQHTLRGLLRATGGTRADKFPFTVRFAFPAELLRRLRNLAANPEKDFDSYLLIKWTASELITLAGNRLRSYLDLYHPGAYVSLRLPARHDHRDSAAAAATLRALLPAQQIRTELGITEDPVAYVMRHTQLLPRHVIQLLNAIFRKTISRDPLSIPIATERDVIQGVHESEERIVEGILSTYSLDYPYVARALEIMKNHIPVTLPCRDLHVAFNNASGRRSGLEYDEFLDSAFAIGALGIVEESTRRYTIGHFSYTFAGTLSAVEDEDSVCVHPLFMPRLFDRRQVRKLLRAKALPVYPYGSDVDDDDHER